MEVSALPGPDCHLLQGQPCSLTAEGGRRRVETGPACLWQLSGARKPAEGPGCQRRASGVKFPAEPESKKRSISGISRNRISQADEFVPFVRGPLYRHRAGTIRILCREAQLLRPRQGRIAITFPGRERSVHGNGGRGGTGMVSSMPEEGREPKVMAGYLPPPAPGPAPREEETRMARTGKGALVFVFGGLLRLILSVVFRGFRSSGAYREAFARAASHPQVRRELGDPVRAGWWVSGSIQVSGPEGNARFAAPLHGPKGRGMLQVQARKIRDRWQFDILQVAVEGGSRPIELLGPVVDAEALPENT